MKKKIVKKKALKKVARKVMPKTIVKKKSPWTWAHRAFHAGIIATAASTIRAAFIR